jgi:hypothetical protein
MADDSDDDPNDRACTHASPPPLWMLSECGSRDEARHAMASFRLVRTVADGDCLFHSVHLCMLSVAGERARVPTSAQLREAVARTALDRHDGRATAALESWRAALAAGDRDLCRDYAHARPLLCDSPPFSDRSRRRVYEAMRDRRVYWGDEYAIDVLERILGVRILVVSPDRQGRCRGMLRYDADRGGGVLARRRRSGRAPFIVLALAGAHYKPLARRRHDRRGRARFVAAFASAESVPAFVREAFAATVAEARTPASMRAARRANPLEPFA